MKIYFEEIFPQYVHSNGNRINIPIVDTEEIIRMVDIERAKDGKRPFLENIDGLTIDENGFYEVRLVIDKEDGHPICIEAWTDNADEPDDTIYRFIIKDKKEIAECLNNELSKNNMTLDDLRKID